MLKISIIILLFILTLNQFNQKFSGQSSQKKPTEIDQKKNALTKIEGSIGIITENSKYEFGDTIPVLNCHGYLLKPIVITDEYQILDLRVISINNDYYRIRISDSVDGYLSKSNPLIEFQTWEKHVLSLFSVGFNPKENPIRKNLSSSSEIIPYEKDEFYLPVQIKDDWLQIKWGSEENWNYGWIRWKANNKLLIELFYFA